MPQLAAGKLLIRSQNSLISTGTERMLLEFGRASYLEKARQQPDKVRQVIQKIKTDGLAPTIAAVSGKLSTPLPMGYANVGQVTEVGDGVEGFSPGDRVASNGPHAEYVCVPANLCARVPENVASEDACFAILGAIALQGIRLVGPTIGERLAVIGLGLVGLLTAQILRANGCKVLGIDIDSEKARLAASMGFEAVDVSAGQDPLAAAEAFSAGQGVDAVIIAASTKSDGPVHQAATMCRKRGRIVLVGVTGLSLKRADCYEKELTFQVSCSYGPGRHDPNYEGKGLDYPIGFVRWTEQRNIEAVLEFMRSGAVTTGQLISHRFTIDDAPAAYEALGSSNSNLGIVLNYPLAQGGVSQRKRSIDLGTEGEKRRPIGQPTISAIGAGNYASRILLPVFKSAGAELNIVASKSGFSGTISGKTLGFRSSTTDLDYVFADQDSDAVVIATPHNTHAKLTIRALAEGKSVFVEKPLALDRLGLDEIKSAYRDARKGTSKPILMVGFNRRFSPFVTRLKVEMEKSNSPAAIVYTVNAGRVPADHWIQDPDVGGGRIIGEACHFVDLARFLAGAPISTVSAKMLHCDLGASSQPESATITIGFENGAMATIHYLANGHGSFPKERVEVFQSGKILRLDNFRRLKGFGSAGCSMWRLKQDKGQHECVSAFLDALRSGGESPIPFDQLIEVSEACIEAWEQINA